MSYKEYVKHVDGLKKRDIFLFTLSTCVWCKKTKAFLNKMGLDYKYVDMDTLPEKEQEEAKKDQMKYNQDCSYPYMVVDNKKCIIGFKPDEYSELFNDRRY